MKKFKINLNKFSKSPQPCLSGRQAPISAGLNMVADFLKRGKVVIYPTDTIYGIGCLATNKKVIKKIFKIKKREKGKPLLILVNSLAMVKKYCLVSGGQEEYLRRAWNIKIPPTLPVRQAGPFIKGGAVTVILKSRGVLPKELTGGLNSIAVRLPKNEFLVKIIKAVGVPIVSTSANLSGKKYNGDVEKMNKLFNKKVDLIADAGVLNNKPSRIVDLRDIGNIKVIRK